MEDWELELEFLTWDAHERHLNKQKTGSEEVEVSPEDFAEDVKEFASQNAVAFDPNEWEELNG